MIRALIGLLDVRARLLILAGWTVFFFLPLPPAVSAIYLGVLALIVALALGAGGLARPLLSILPLLVFVLLLTPPFYPDGREILVLRGLPLLTTGGLRLALRLMIRFTGITLAFYLFMRTTRPEDLIAALGSLGVPFAVSLVISLAVRTIPRTAALYRDVVDAHDLRRGGPPAAEGRPPHRRWRDLLPVLTSVLIQSVRGIPILSMALEIRGVGRENPRSRYLEVRSGLSLLPHLLLALLALLVLFAPPLFMIK